MKIIYDDLISKATVLDLIRNSGLTGHDYRIVIDEIKNLPSAEPQIVRCEKCKWWYYEGSDTLGNRYGACCNPAHFISDSQVMHASFFCEGGTPRED